MEFDLKFVVLVVLLYSIPSSSSKSLRELSLEEYNNLSSSSRSSFVAVYFDNKDFRKKYPNLLKEIRKSYDLLDTYGVQLARIDCATVSLEACSEENLYTFRNGVYEDSLGLDIVFNVDAIVANLLQLLLKSEIEYLPNMDHVKQMIQEAKHEKKDLVFAYVKGLGNSDHATFTKVAFVYAENMSFGITTNEHIAKQIEGLSTKTSGSLAVHMCKDASLDESIPCKVKTAKKMTVIHIAQLIQMLRLPQFVYLPENGTTIYDTLPLSVNKVYIFTDKIDNLNLDQVKDLAGDLVGTGGVVLVDVNKHKDKLAQFGLSESDSFPTAAYLPASSVQSEQNVELFPAKIHVFSLEVYRHYLGLLLHNPVKEYRLSAQGSSLRSITYNQFSKISSPVKTFLFRKSFLLIAFCKKGSVHAGCQDFAKSYRRLVRTFDNIDENEMHIVHVTLEDGQDVHIGKQKLPFIQLHSSEKPEDFTIYKGKPDYNGLIKFIEEKNSIPSVTRLPPSNVDSVPIDPESNDKTEDDKEEEPSEERSEERSEEGKEDEVEIQPEETEDDEVAGAVWYSDLPNVPEDKVPSLTDKTFTPTRDNNDLLVVNFFQPWDPRSRALVGPYVQAAMSLGDKDVGNFRIRLARVNCFDWTDVCHKNNITTYPTIKLYRKGSDELLYQGPLDADHLVKSVLLLHSSSPLQLDTQDKIESFLSGEYPLNAKEASDTAVVGLFAGVKTKELIKVFSESAKQLRGSHILGFATGKTAKQAAIKHGVKVPAVFLFKRNEANRPLVVFDKDFSTKSIVEFVRLSTISLFGELTPVNLPLYFKHRRPLLIAFRATLEADSTVCPIMEKLSQDPSVQPVMLAWMALSSNDVNDVILETYTGKTDVPALVLLYHSRGVVYHYKDEMSLEEITAWVKRCLSGEQNPSRFLKNGNWKPLLDGYDYLAMLDQEQKDNMRKHNEDEEESNEMTGKPNQRLEKRRQRKPEDYRDDEEIKQHDEL